MSELPETMADVTPQWLRGAVAGHPAFHDAQITRLSGAPVGEGIGQMSAIARLEIQYEGAPGPASVVVKLHAPFQAMRDIGVRYDMFARETAFYQSLAREVTVPVPTIYFAGWDPSRARNAMVMEDMTRHHWPDQLSGHTLERARHCVDAIARLGAKHWAADFSAYPWLPDSRAPVILRIVGDYRQAAPVVLERLAEFVTPRTRGACERIARNIDWIFETLARPPLILTHFDPRLENFVFADESSASLCLIDWQLMTRFHPGWDIAYFLGTSLPEDLRRAWQAQLLARYLGGLASAGVRNYDASELDADFRLATMAMTVIPVLGGAAFDISNPRSTALFGAILARSLASVVDNNCVALLPA